MHTSGGGPSLIAEFREQGPLSLLQAAWEQQARRSNVEPATPYSCASTGSASHIVRGDTVQGLASGDIWLRDSTSGRWSEDCPLREPVVANAAPGRPLPVS